MEGDASFSEERRRREVTLGRQLHLRVGQYKGL